MVEQWTHKPLVVGSSPTLATKILTPESNQGFSLFRLQSSYEK